MTKVLQFGDMGILSEVIFFTLFIMKYFKFEYFSRKLIDVCSVPL